MGAIGIEFKNDRTRAKEELEGSDGRANVSSRSDDRSYYNSRDEKQTYSFVYEFNAAESGEFAAYLKNTSTVGLQFIPTQVFVSASANIRIKLWSVTGTAAGGTEVVGANDNLTTDNTPTALAQEGGSAATGITGLTTDRILGIARCGANDTQIIPVKDSVRLGQNNAIAVEVDDGTAADVEVTVLGYFEAI